MKPTVSLRDEEMKLNGAKTVLFFSVTFCCVVTSHCDEGFIDDFFSRFPHLPFNQGQRPKHFFFLFLCCSKLGQCLDKLQLTERALGRVYNFRSGCMHTMHLLPGVAIQPNLELKTRPKPVLGSLPLAFALPGQCYKNYSANHSVFCYARNQSLK